MSIPDFPDNKQPTSGIPVSGPAAVACPRCGVMDLPRLSPGSGPHAYRADCAHCGGFLKWVSRYTHEERVHRRKRGLRTVLEALPPPERQLTVLQDLGYQGDAPTSRLAASELIDALLQQRGS